MSAYDATEEEQIEQLKRFWSRYGLRLTLMFCIVFLGYVSFYFWNQRQESRQLEASHLYQTLIKSVELKKNDIKSLAEGLMEQHPQSTYAVFSALILAKTAVEAAEWDKAISSLQWVLSHSSEPYFQFLAKTRLSRIYLEKKEPDNAWALVKNTGDTGPYRVQFAELKGDILFAKGDFEKARAAYQIALAALPEKSNNQLLLQIKIDDMAIGMKKEKNHQEEQPKENKGDNHDQKK